MTEQINDQISAFIDNELPADESALLVRRFERDPEARARAMRYTLIGAAMRGELLDPHPTVLRQRVAAALAGAAPSTARVRAGWSERFARPLLGLGIAAAVAIVAIGALRFLNDESFAPGGAPGAAPLQTNVPVPEPSYVVPQEVDETRVVTPPTMLTNYLIVHREYASGLTRNAVSSNVVGAATETPERETAVGKPLPVEQEGLE
jgi:sigma-E factor negative regulatory protein RseA